MASALDLFVIYKFIRILSTPWKKTEAYKLGIIDEKGKILRKRSELDTTEEKKASSILHGLVWKLKRIMEKIPIVRSRIGSFATALYLIKEETGISKEVLEESFSKYMMKHHPEDLAAMLSESTTENPIIKRGVYRINGERIVIHENIKPLDTIMSVPIYKYQDLIFVQDDIGKELYV